jgi:rubrerythrin
MADLKGTKSEKDLLDAFAGESQANRKYLAFAKQAAKEGHPQVAKLFRAAAEAETVHAHNHLRTLGGVNATADNLKEGSRPRSSHSTSPTRLRKSMLPYTSMPWTTWIA